MREIKMTMPVLGLVAVTRALLGVGIGLILSKRIRKDRRISVGSILAAIGALTTIPLAITVHRRLAPPTESSAG